MAQLQFACRLQVKLQILDPESPLSWGKWGLGTLSVSNPMLLGWHEYLCQAASH